MERRNFIKNTSLGLGSFLLIPSIADASVFGLANESQLIPLAKLSGQIRHGALILPQIGYKNDHISFDWLDDVTRNVFFENGFQQSQEEKDLEIVSILLTDPETGDPESIQIQKVNKEITLLYEDLEWTLDSEMKGLNLLNPEESVFLKVYFGNAAKGESIEYKIDRQTNREVECYVHIFDGSLKVNEQVLENDYGLGLKAKSNVHFEALESSRFLVLST